LRPAFRIAGDVKNPGPAYQAILMPTSALRILSFFLNDAL
jgi:hypothetical protein